MTLGEKIKNKRIEQRLTLEMLAKKVGISRQTISKYELGNITNIPSDKIEALAKALHTTPAYLMGWEEDELRKESNTKAFEFAMSEGKALTPEQREFDKLYGKLLSCNLSVEEIREISEYVSFVVYKRK